MRGDERRRNVRGVDGSDDCRAGLRTGVTLVEVLTVIVVVGLLIGVWLTRVLHAQDRAKLNACANNMKQLALALLNYEDKRHCLPPISMNSDPTPDIPGDTSATTDVGHPAPGTAPSTGAGYSWIVMILPEVEEGPLYQAIANNSRRFTKSAFSSEIINGMAEDSAPHVASVELAAFRCPEFTGGATIDTSERTVGDNQRAVESGTVPPNYNTYHNPKVWHTSLWHSSIGITNYNAILGTHIDDVGPAVAVGPYPLKSASLPNSNNGGMKFRGTSFDQGWKLAAFTDGTSKVPVIAETRERRFSSWYDGTMNWVVAARHSNQPDGTKAITAANINGQPVGAKLKTMWKIGTDGTPATGGVALNYGPTAERPTAVYLPSDALADPDISNIPPGRLWGPSSEHAGGIVNHGFADAHVEGISDGIDPNVYLWIVTRNGGEAIP